MNPDELFKDGVPYTSCDKKIVCSDRKSRSKYVALNGSCKKTCRIHIDGDLMKGKTKRCDFGLWVEEGNRMILIELKGSDVDTAYRQLQSSLGFFHSKFRREGFVYSLRIVPTRVTTPNLQTMVKMERKKGVDLLVHSVCLEERI